MAAQGAARIAETAAGRDTASPWGGSFLQVLEGEVDDVRSVYGTISKDPRHERVVKLLETTVSSRSFGDWSMGFAAGEQIRAAKLDGHNDLLRSDFSPASFLPDREGAKARQILLAFREGRWRTFIGSSGPASPKPSRSTSPYTR